MKNAKPAIAFMCPVMFCASLAGAEYNLVMWFGTLFSVFASLFGWYLLLLWALFRAPEGYEDENGFHIGVPLIRPPDIFVVSASRSWP